MLEFRLVPQFRNNCVIQGKKELVSSFKEGDTVFLLSKIPTKTFSILTKVEGIIDSDENLIYIDQRILGKLAENDMVTILKHNPAEALTIYLAISESFSRVFSGDWTSFAKKPLENKVFDFGQEVSFIIPWEDEHGNQLPPIAISGFVYSTVPTPPIKVGLQTKIYLKKFPELQLQKIKQTGFEKQEARVNILDNEIQQNILHLMQTIKQNNYPTKANKYKFKNVNAKQLFASINEVFKGFRVVEGPTEKTFDSENQSFLGSIVYLAEETTDSLAVIDLQVLAKNQNGEVILMVTAKDNDVVYNLLNKYDLLIRKIKIGLEEKAELKVEICPSCGADLPLDDVDSDGSIECLYCHRTSIIPKSYRY